MKLSFSNGTLIWTGVTVSCAAMAAFSAIYQQLEQKRVTVETQARQAREASAFQQRQQSRSSALSIVAKQAAVNGCLQVPNPKNTLLKIGEPITLPGDNEGRSPSSCIRLVKKVGNGDAEQFGNGDAEQFGYLAYLNGKLQIVYVFTPKEIQNTKL